MSLKKEYQRIERTIIVECRLCYAHYQMAFNIIRQNRFRAKRTFKAYIIKNGKK